MREIGDLLLRMPRPLLLLLKTNDCLRSVDGALGSPLNTVRPRPGARVEGAPLGGAPGGAALLLGTLPRQPRCRRLVHP
jgi:aarF domain-containing kinase